MVKKYKVLEVGKNWYEKVKINEIYTIQQLKETWNISLKDWDYTLKDLNNKLCKYKKDNRYVVFKEVI